MRDSQPIEWDQEALPHLIAAAYNRAGYPITITAPDVERVIEEINLVILNAMPVRDDRDRELRRRSGLLPSGDQPETWQEWWQAVGWFILRWSIRHLGVITLALIVITVIVVS